MEQAQPEVSTTEPSAGSPPQGSPQGSPGHRVARGALTVGALGVVFGDIGTSPIYTIQTVFNPEDPHPVPVSQAHVYGIVSLIFWAVTLIVTIKYVMLVLRADNDGEGGILALITLIRRRAMPGSHRTKIILAGLGIFGASLFFGDSMITPAISVLSAVEGLKIVNPSFEAVVIPITAVIIIALFSVQRLGTAKVGRAFGPVMILWFSAIGVCGLVGVIQDPAILLALSPTYAVGFLVKEFPIAFFALAAVVLAITGAEALYADLGHFGRPPIARAWLILVFPACILSYMGQGALVLKDPANATASPFFLLVPEWGRVPMVVLATAATVIASQAVITGAFSVAHQAIQLGYLPRLRTTHTSSEAFGQIYVPYVNWVLMIMVLTLVFAFQTSAALAYAFGMAVTGTITITTILFFYQARKRWGKPVWMVVGGAVVFLSIELLFLAANLTKIAHGAWLPLLIALVVFVVMSTWQRGRHLVTRLREQQEGSLVEFVDELRDRTPELVRVPGTAVFMNRDKETTPLAMRSNVEHNHVLHRHVVILSIQTQPAPYVRDADKIIVDDLGYADDGITHVSARVGYMDESNVPHLLGLAVEAGLECPLEINEATYYLSTIEISTGDEGGQEMARWRKRLFVATSSITADAAEYFALPRDRTIIMGSRISI